MINKRKLFEVFLDRMAKAEAAGMPFEAAWYAYAILEDRLVSMLRNSGGENRPNGKAIKMMGPKIEKLRERASVDALLAANFPEYDVEDIDETELWKWKSARDELIHAMARGELTLDEIDEKVSKLAADGAKLAREYAAAAARLKKHRHKVPQS